MKNLKFLHSLANLALILVISMLTACGGEEKSASNTPTVSGAVIKGVMSHAVVSLYRISSPNAPAELIQTLRTNEDGTFKTSIEVGTDPILVQVTADAASRMICDLSTGCFNEVVQQWHAFGDKMPVAADFQLLGTLSKQTSRAWVSHVSPVSHLIISTALNLPGGLNQENVETATEWVQQALRLNENPLSTPNIDLTQTEAINQATYASILQSVIGASFFGLSQTQAWKEAAVTANNLNLNEVMATAAQLTNDLDASFPQEASEQMKQFAIASAALSSNEGLEIIAAPRSMSVTEGDGFYFRVHAISNRPLSYQWYRDGLPVNGATEAVFGHATAELGDAGRYQVRVSDGTESYFSHSARLWVNESINKLAITKQPISQMLVTGQTLNLSVDVSSNENVQVLWQRNGSILPQFSGTRLDIAAVSESDAGNYRAIVTDGLSLQYSDFASVYVSPQASALSFLEQPQSMTLMTGQTARFSAKALGSGYITYQWYKNGKALANQYSQQLTISSVDALSEGTYAVRASNSQGSVVSASARLSVVSDTLELELLEEPQGADLYIGEETILRVTALGGTDFNYQWYKDGTPISGATSNRLTISADSVSETGSYSVVVANAYGTIQSRNALITVSEPPSLSLSWSMPVERENGEPLSPHEIHGYILEYSYGATSDGQRAQITGAQTTSHTLSKLRRGLLYLRIATVDSDGVIGRFSAPISINLP